MRILFLAACFGICSNTAFCGTDVTIMAVTPDRSVSVDLTEGGELFTDGPDSGFVVVSKTEKGHTANYAITDDETFAPEVVGTILSDSWFKIEFNTSTTRGANRVARFDPYNSINTDWLFGTHVLAPNSHPLDYEFRVTLQRNNCSGVPPEECELFSSVFEYEVVEIPAPLAGDVNLDGTVAFDDFLVLSRQFQPDVFAAQGGWLFGDFNLDSVVGFEDFLMMSGNFGKSIEGFEGVSVVPEPSANLMLITAGLALLGLQRRPKH